nr:MAG: hypothetical protein DIU70_04605 [Bacillota bacterium]
MGILTALALVLTWKHKSMGILTALALVLSGCGSDPDRAPSALPPAPEPEARSVREQVPRWTGAAEDGILAAEVTLVLRPGKVMKGTVGEPAEAPAPGPGNGADRHYEVIVTVRNQGTEPVVLYHDCHHLIWLKGMTVIWDCEPLEPVYLAPGKEFSHGSALPADYLPQPVGGDLVYRLASEVPDGPERRLPVTLGPERP